MGMASREGRLNAAIALREHGEHIAACTALSALSRDYPDDSEVLFQCAWAHDKAEMEAEALPFYERALAVPGLNDRQRQEALLGMGSTYRVLGRASDAVRVLERAVEEFPADNALRVFLAMARFDAGHRSAAFGALLFLLGELADDAAIHDYRRPIAQYADSYLRSDRVSD